jgi:hypothetical protein
MEPHPRYDQSRDPQPGGPPRSTAPPVEPGRPPRSERPIGALLSELVREMRQLVRKETHLARSELHEKLSQAGTGATSLGAGALVTFAGVLFLLQSAVLGLDLWLQTPWLSALIVGGAVALIGLVLLARGRSNLNAENLTPSHTARSLQRDAELVRQEMGRNP